MKNYNFKMLEPFVIFLCGASVAVALMIYYFSPNGVMQACVQEINSSDNDLPLQIFNQFNLSDLQVANPTKETDFDQELSELLQKVAMDDKTVIMTVTNGAWSEPNSLFDLFLESFHVGDQIEHLLNHMIVVARDDKAFTKCKSVHPFCYQFKVNGVDFTGEKSYKTKDYLKMVWSKINLQQTILEMGYNLLFTDADIMWFRNPLQHISVIAQMTVSCDKFRGNPDDLTTNDANTGFMYVKPTNRTIAFYKDWYESRVNYTTKHDQEAFQDLQAKLSAKHQVRIQFLDTSYVGGICQPRIDFKKLCTFHATCRVGLVSKTNEMRKILNEWKTFKEKNMNVSRSSDGKV